ncbi:uncharacterized protein LOC128418927 [Podarcis raffonei]|uniref:uncharacterized protein LOC128418927 n=1 Tax=Podarcis raffonei TaxID=65483 RepID=UPI0023290DFE|nr:uncharacterized protein LOC128418927 [Podarcis raffonei]
MPKRKCKFSVGLQKKYTCFRRGRDDFEGECMICKPGTFVSVANKGGRDLQSHVKSEKHKKAIRGEASSAQLTDFFIKPCSKLEDEVTAAEGTFAFHTVKHHNSYNVMTCTSGLLKTTFPDSNIARKFSSAKTKTEAIVNSVLAPDCLENVLKSIEENDICYCGVSTDGSNHGSVKVFPIVIQYFDWKSGGLQSKIIEMRSQPNETADTILSYVKETLESKGLLKKCIAFIGDNCNTMFGGIRWDSEGRNVFAKLNNELDNKTLIGVGCPGHILNNCVHQAAETLDIDVESIIFKIYQYFHIYTVQTEQLKEYCEFVDTEYKKLLSHSKTRWLSLFPGVNRLIRVFPAVKAFILSQNNPPTVLKRFFEHAFSEVYLLHLQSLMSMFHSYILELERENNSVVEVLKVLLCVQNVLNEHKSNNFMSLKVKSLLEEKRKEGLGAECNKFYAEVNSLYDSCIEYLGKWMESMKEFSCFMWMSLSESLEWDKIELSIKFLLDRDVSIDDVKCFDQFCNLKKFVDQYKGDDGFINLQAHQKWTKYFETSQNMCHSELLKIAQFFFAVASHDNANMEHIFSLMQSWWSKERGHLSLESLRSILLVQYNYKHFTCKEFHAYLLSNKQLLSKIRSTEKYAWARQHQKEEQSAFESDIP